MGIKERITVEQLQELNGLQEMALRSLWDPNTGDVILTKSGGVQIITHVDEVRLHCVEEGCPWTDTNVLFQPGCLPLLSIGQMISLLNVKASGWTYDWYAAMFEAIEDDRFCDELWGLVKERVL